MRILAIDYGKRRTGIAVTDPLQLIANGLTTVDTKQLMAFLTDYFRREEVEHVVIGLPVQPDGTPSENQQRVRTFTGEFWYQKGQDYEEVIARSSAFLRGKIEEAEKLRNK